jgi:hypothetical protein
MSSIDDDSSNDILLLLSSLAANDILIVSDMLIISDILIAAVLTMMGRDFVFGPGPGFDAFVPSGIDIIDMLINSSGILKLNSAAASMILFGLDAFVPNGMDDNMIDMLNSSGILKLNSTAASSMKGLLAFVVLGIMDNDNKILKLISSIPTSSSTIGRQYNRIFFVPDTGAVISSLVPSVK